jgi:hypothetical protein
MATYKKGDQETISFGVDWSDWLTEEGVEISSSSWDVPAGVTKESEASDLTSTSIFLSGGEVGEVYKITNVITTTAQGATALIAERSFNVAVVLDKYR